MKLSLSRLFNQDIERSSISKYFKTEVRFSSWITTLKLFSLVKIIGQRVARRLSLRSLGGNLHALSTILHVLFNSTFNWTSDIWSMYSCTPLQIFGSCSNLNVCRSEKISNVLIIIKQYSIENVSPEKISCLFWIYLLYKIFCWVVVFRVLSIYIAGYSVLMP